MTFAYIFSYILKQLISIGHFFTKRYIFIMLKNCQIIENYEKHKNSNVCVRGTPVSNEVFGCVKYRCYSYITAKKFISLKKSHSTAYITENFLNKILIIFLKLLNIRFFYSWFWAKYFDLSLCLCACANIYIYRYIQIYYYYSMLITPKKEFFSSQIFKCR